MSETGRGAARGRAADALALSWIALVACGGQPYPAEYDAKPLAAELEAVSAEMAAIARGLDCAVVVRGLDQIEQRTRGTFDQARQAQHDPDHAKRLTAALHAYDQAAAGRANAIATKLAICFREHRELQDEIKRVVDSMPTL